MKFLRDLPLLLAALLVVVAGVYFAKSPAASRQGAETIYVVNHAGQYISDAQIRKDIPSWEQAANKDFSPVWQTPQVKIQLVSHAPAGSISALFVKNGPIQGALAYHTVTQGVPKIVVYAGVADFYGYSNSVSFTHELFELLADPTVSATNQGYPYPAVCNGTGGYGEQCQGIYSGTIWFQEACDPVEAFSYQINGVPISDFITPNWFNDEMKAATGGSIDFMGELGAPLTVAKGGYAQFWDGTQWNLVQNFRHAGRDANGFLKGEKGERGR